MAGNLSELKEKLDQSSSCVEISSLWPLAITEADESCGGGAAPLQNRDALDMPLEERIVKF